MKKRGRPKHPELLTPREQEVLALLREGLTNPQIAERLGIGLEGVKYHVSEILSKLQVSSREEAARWSAEGARPWWLGAIAFWHPHLLAQMRAASIAAAGGVLAAAAAGLVLLAVLLARSDGGSDERTIAQVNATPTGTPEVAELLAEFTPVVVELTPPPGIDTSDWLTYRDEEHGFEFRYPQNASVEKNVQAQQWGPRGTGTEVDIPLESSTTLGYKYLFVSVGGEWQMDCVPTPLVQALQEGATAEPQATPPALLLRSPSARFWQDKMIWGGAFSYATADRYLTTQGKECVALWGVAGGVSRGAFADPPPTPTEEEASTLILTAMVATFRWLDST